MAEANEGAERKEQCRTCANCDDCPHGEMPDEDFTREWGKYFDEGIAASDIALVAYALGHKAGRTMTECGEWAPKKAEARFEKGGEG